MKFWIILALAVAASAENLPTELKLCHRLADDFNSCLVQAITGAMKFFKDGNKLLGMAPLDPFLVDYAAINHTSGNPNFNLRSSLTNTDFIGLGKSDVQRLKTKFDGSFALKSESKIEVLQLIGDYTMNGQILVLPIQGAGRCNITMLDVTALVDMRGSYVEKDGEKYIHIDGFKIKISPKKSIFKFDNIFKGDPLLSDQINSFMNENHEVVCSTLLPGYEENFGGKFKVLANALFDKIPMKLIFPE